MHENLFKCCFLSYLPIQSFIAYWLLIEQHSFKQRALALFLYIAYSYKTYKVVSKWNAYGVKMSLNI
jgi:hypothetical protein